MSILKGIQQQVADQLVADPNFALIPVLTEALMDIDSQIAIGLGPWQQKGAVGLVAIVTTPTANATWPNVPGPFFDHIPVTVTIIENVQTNRIAGGTQIDALSCAENVCAALQHFFPLDSNGPLLPKQPTIRLVPDPDYLSYNCYFETMGGIRTVTPNTATVADSVTGGVHTLTCATPGAAIFYTTDGSQASPRNAAATLYTAPFTPATGLTLTARAWLAGYLASLPFTIGT